MKKVNAAAVAQKTPRVYYYMKTNCPRLLHFLKTYGIINSDNQNDQEVMIMFCTRCGNSVSEDDRFCRKCGAPLDVPQMPSDAPVKNDSERRRQAAPVKERRTAPPENEKMKIILPLAILTIVLFAFIIVLIVLLNRPDPEPPVPRQSSRVSSIESASIEPETTTTTEVTTTETTTTTAPVDRILIQDLASFSEGEVRAEPAAVSENNVSVVYYPAETGGDMYYYVVEWMDYLKKDSKLSYVGASGSDVLYTAYYDCSDNTIEKKKTKVDGKTKKQDYVLALVVVNDPNTNAVLSVTANMSIGLNVSDLDFRFSGDSMTTTSTTTTAPATTTVRTTKKNDKRTNTTTQKATTVKTTTTTSSTTRKTETTTAAPAVITNSYLQSLDDFSNGGIKGGVPEFTDKFTAISYEQADRNSDITDIVNVWLQGIFDESDFTYVGMKESDGHIIYYFDYDSGRSDKPKADMDNESGKKEYSLEIDCIYSNSETITKVNVRACNGIIIDDMGERF